MRFLLKALFFLAVVAAFIPRPSNDAAAPQPALQLTQSSDAALDVTGMAQDQTGNLCAQRPALCQAAQESLAAARLVGDVAVNVAMQQARRDENRPAHPSENPAPAIMIAEDSAAPTDPADTHAPASAP